MVRTFHLYRDEDVHGVSGTGIVAWGIEFPDGKVALRWNGDGASTSTWDSIDHLRQIHGHDGATQVVWGDTPDTQVTEDRYFTVTDYIGHSIRISVEESAAEAPATIHVGGASVFGDGVHFGPHLDEDGWVELLAALLDAGETRGWDWA